MSSTVRPFSFPFQEGELICGRFQTEALVHVSALSFVVSALDTARNARVALKFARPTAFGYENLKDRFADAARSSCTLQSDFVVRVFEVGYLVEKDTSFIVMEWLEGQSLRQWLTEREPQSVESVATLGMQVCAGLAAGHAQGMIHGGVHPNNLFLAHDAHAGDIIKVLDFGISQAALDGDAIGSLAYLSPEQMRAKRQADARTDIWSLGCVLYELLSGRSPFDAPSPIQVCAAVLEADPPALRAPNDEIPAALEAVVRQCLEKDPSLRYQTVDELAQALEPFAARDAFEEMAQDVATSADRATDGERTSDVGLRATGADFQEEEFFSDNERTELYPAEAMRAPLIESTSVPALADEPAVENPAGVESTLPPSATVGLGEEPSSEGDQSPPSRSTSRSVYFVLAVLMVGVFGIIAARDLSSPPHVATRMQTPALRSDPIRKNVEKDATSAQANAALEPREPSHPALEPETSSPSKPARVTPSVAPALHKHAAHNVSAVQRRPPDRTQPASPSANAEPTQTSVADPDELRSSTSSSDTERQRASTTAVHDPPPVATHPTSAQPEAPSSAFVDRTATQGSATALPRRPAPGTIAPATVAGVIRNHAAAIQDCFDRAQMNHLDLRGRLFFHAAVDELGNVTKAWTDNQFDNGASLNACIVSNARGWKFPPPVGGTSAVVSYTFVFD